jgi:hypothetical protein
MADENRRVDTDSDNDSVHTCVECKDSATGKRCIVDSGVERKKNSMATGISIVNTRLENKNSAATERYIVDDGIESKDSVATKRCMVVAI